MMKHTLLDYMSNRAIQINMITTYIIRQILEHQFITTEMAEAGTNGNLSISICMELIVIQNLIA